MGQLIYGLCALTSIACAVLLARGYSASGHRLLFWSGGCFVALALNNVVLVLDKIVYVNTDLSMVRFGLALAAVAMLLFGLVWEDK